MKRNFFKRLRYLWKLSKVVPTHWIIVGNRTIEKGMVGTLEVTTIVRETSQPDAYERTELCEMLATIREQEKIQGWLVPEPHPVITGWIKPCDHQNPSEAQLELEAIGVIVIYYDATQDEFKVKVPPEALDRLDKLWGPYIWGLK